MASFRFGTVRPSFMAWQRSRPRLAPWMLLSSVLASSSACSSSDEEGTDGGAEGGDGSVEGGASGSAGGASGMTSAGSEGGGGIAGPPASGGDGGTAPPASGGDGGITIPSDSGEEGGTGIDPNDTPPVIVDVSPANGAKGVLSDAVISITFDRPMDQVSVQAAYQSADLPAGEVLFDWFEQGRVLTVTPNAGLPYARGNDAEAVVANSYSYSITTTAQDRAGNQLKHNRTVTFETARAIDRLVDASWAYAVLPSGSPSSPVVVGDQDDNQPFRGFVSFDLSSLPDDVLDLQAEYKVVGELGPGTFIVFGQPWAVLGDLLLDHVYVETVDATAFNTTPLRQLGVLMDEQPTELGIGIDVSAAVLDDLENRGDRSNESQYRLMFELPTNGDGEDDFVLIGHGNQQLDITYLIP